MTPLVLIAGATLVAGSPAGGAGPSPALREIVEETLTRSPELAAIDRRIAAARARAPQAAALPDPMFGIQYVNDHWKPTLGEEMMTTLGFMFSQPLPYPGKRGARSDIEAGEVKRLQASRRRLERTLVAEASRAYVDLVAAREQIALVERQGRLWQLAVEAARARYESGGGTLQDQLRGQIEIERLAGFRVSAESAVTAAVARINALRASPPDRPVETPAAVEPAPAPPRLGEYVPAAERELPEMAELGAQREAEQAGAELARLSGRPDFEVEGGYMNRGGLPPMWQLGLRFTLPVWRSAKVGPALRERSENLAGLARQEEGLRLRLRRATEVRLAQLGANARIEALYRERILPLDQDSVDAALAGFRSGRTPFVAVLEAMQGQFQDHQQHVLVRADGRRLWIELEEASLDAGAPALRTPSAGAMGGMGAGAAPAPAAGMSSGGGMSSAGTNGGSM